MSASEVKNINRFKGFFQWRSITTRLTLYHLLILLSSLWIVTAIGSYFLKQDLQRASGEQQLSTATIVAKQIHHELILLAANFNGVADQIDSKLLANPTALHDMLEKNTHLQLSFNEGLFVTGENGEVIASLSTNVPRIDTSFINETILSAIQTPGKSTIFDVAVDKRLDVPVIRVVAPLRDARGRVTGVLFGVINLALSNLLTPLITNHYGKTGGYFLSSPKLRMIIATSDKARMMEKFPAIGANPDIDYFLAGGQGSRVIRNAIGIEVLASVVPVPATGWILAVALPTTEAFLLMHDLQRRLLFLAGLLTAVMGVLTWWMLRHQLAGLALANTALIEQSKNLDVAHRLPVTEDNEVGELVGGFNHLLALLRERDTALVWSEQRFRAIFDAEPECVKLVAKNGDLLEMNNAGLAMLEVSTLDEARERGLQSFILPQYFLKHTQLLARVIAGNAGDLEFEIEGVHGTRRWMQSHAISLKNKQDGTTMMLSVTRDITQQKLAQLALIESEMRWKFAVEGSGDGLWDWSVTERTVFFNTRWKEVLGFAHDEASIALDDWNARIHPDDLARVSTDLQNCLSGESKFYSNEHRVLSKDGHWKWVLDRAMVVQRDEKNQALRMIGTYSDITEHKQLQESLQASLKEKVLLLNEVHHRVKNNLQVISSLLNLECSRSDSSDTQHVLKSMQGRIRSMALLHQSLYRSGIFASADLGAYLQELASQAFRAQATSGGAVKLKLDLERVMVSMDQAAPCGLLANELIANSFKHAFPNGAEGEIRLALQMLPDSNKVRLSVSDNGAGLPADFSTKRVASLGLQLVSDLARQIGGNLEIGAEPEARFFVDFVPEL